MPEKRKRDGRVPLHKQNRIGIKPTKGFKPRLVNEQNGERIAKFEKAGYRIMHKPIKDGRKDAADASQFGSVARQPVGGGEYATYMEIPEELYKADQAEKQLENDRTMRQIGHLKNVPKSVQRGEVVIEHEIPEK